MKARLPAAGVVRDAGTLTILHKPCQSCKLEETFEKEANTRFAPAGPAPGSFSDGGEVEVAAYPRFVGGEDVARSAV